MIRRDTYRSDGIATVVVLWVIMVLSLLIGGFAFRMQVETQVASFSRKELKAQMLARSGVEVARMELLLHDKSPVEAGFDALNQSWVTNKEMLVDHELGDGKYTVTITDEERKLPLNRLTDVQLHKLMDVLGVDPLDGDIIVDSILDWTTPGDLHRLNGAKSDYYESLSPPYQCKGAPFDQVQELLLVRGVTKEIFESTPATDKDDARPGLKDMVTTMSAGQVNINTAPAEVLQALLGVEETQTTALMQRRDGADGVPGTDDDLPFRNVDEFLGLVAGANPNATQQLRQFINVSSQFFRIKSIGEVKGAKYTIDTVVRRQNGDCVVVTWNESRGGI